MTALFLTGKVTHEFYKKKYKGKDLLFTWYFYNAIVIKKQTKTKGVRTK